MSDAAYPELNLREELTRIDRQRAVLAEILELQVNEARLRAEGKPTTEERRLNREMYWLIGTTLSGMVATAAVLTALATALLRWSGRC